VKKYHTSSHSKYLLKAHLVFVVKYRKQLLTYPINKSVKQIMFDIANESDFEIEVMECDKDHIHLMIDYPSTLSVVSIVNRLKAVSTNRIWKQIGNLLKTHFWKERTFWSDGYFVASTGDVSSDTIRMYIESQG
jgi:putative transposase